MKHFYFLIHSLSSAKSSYILIFVCACASVSAQSYSFKVLAHKGANEYKSDNEWRPLRTGTILKQQDELKLADDGYVGLVHNSGRPLEIRKPGNYHVKALDENVKPGATVMSKYTDFILSNNSAEGKKNRLSATGAVTRDVTQPLSLVLPGLQHTAVYNDIVIISWDKTTVKGPYVLTLKNMFDDVLQEIETSDKKHPVDIGKFRGEDGISIQVRSKSGSREVSKDHLIKPLTMEERSKINEALKPLEAELAERTALNKLILAAFYEENRLLIDAITAYEEAITIAPDVLSYQEVFDDFLVRNNLAH